MIYELFVFANLRTTHFPMSPYITDKFGLYRTNKDSQRGAREYNIVNVTVGGSHSKFNDRQIIAI